MREIKFRGLRIDNNQWTIGSLVVDTDWTAHCIIDYAVSKTNTYTWEDVKPETVGQFTGLRDKTGKEIYEGDIVQSKAEMVFLLTGKKTGNISDRTHIVECAEDEAMFRLYDITRKRHETSPMKQKYLSQWYTVIGNIHENSELLNPKPIE